MQPAALQQAVHPFPVRGSLVALTHDSNGKRTSCLAALVDLLTSIHRDPRGSVSGFCTRVVLDTALPPLPDRVQILKLSRLRTSLLLSRLALLGGLILLGSQPGCGPAPSDEVSNTSPRASVAGQEARGAGLVVGSSEGVVPLASSLSLAGQGNARPADKLVVPPWMATALENPDVRVRLRALDAWSQSAPTGSVDPLIVALDDDDERVRERALTLIEEDWARAQGEVNEK